jgi:hypothetical protein
LHNISGDMPKFFNISIFAIYQDGSSCLPTFITS